MMNIIKPRCPEREPSVLLFSTSHGVQWSVRDNDGFVCRAVRPFGGQRRSAASVVGDALPDVDEASTGGARCTVSGG
jgi:hypothetical protein